MGVDDLLDEREPEAEAAARRPVVAAAKELLEDVRGFRRPEYPRRSPRRRAQRSDRGSKPRRRPPRLPPHTRRVVQQVDECLLERIRVDQRKSRLALNPVDPDRRDRGRADDLGTV